MIQLDTDAGPGSVFFLNMTYLWAGQTRQSNLRMKNNKPSKKKILFPVKEPLNQYLVKYNRRTRLPIQYEDMLRYNNSMTLYDRKGDNTLWETVYFSEADQAEMFNALTRIYALLKTDGDIGALHHLTVARVDYCHFGNTKPFRVRIINRLNDNYDHFYIKKTDSSRVYGLELEELLSPNHVMYLVDGETLIEEHIAGIPGEYFLERHGHIAVFDQIRIAKEFVKFNERCFVRLLGDMRSYNYVIDITPDIEGNQYRMRAIDFDQQSYEGRLNFYLPQYFKENNPIIFMGIEHMSAETVLQYQLEERTLIGARVKDSQKRVNELLDIMTADTISFPDKVDQLKHELAEHHKNSSFLRCNSMGEIVKNNIQLLLKKDFRQSMP